MEVSEEILGYFDEHRQQAYDLLMELAQIPAAGARQNNPGSLQTLPWRIAP